MTERIIGVKKDDDGNIAAVKTSAGQVYRLDQAIEQVRTGNIEGVKIVDRNGREYLRSSPDQELANNLDRLPTF